MENLSGFSVGVGLGAISTIFPNLARSSGKGVTNMPFDRIATLSARVGSGSGDTACVFAAAGSG